jgi:hypothetical protein
MRPHVSAKKARLARGGHAGTLRRSDARQVPHRNPNPCRTTSAPFRQRHRDRQHCAREEQHGHEARGAHRAPHAAARACAAVVVVVRCCEAHDQVAQDAHPRSQPAGCQHRRQQQVLRTRERERERERGVPRQCGATSRKGVCK